MYIHTCTIPRNIPLENAIEVLHLAKNGDPSVSVSAVRKAAATVGKMIPKVIAAGQNNPACRLMKIWKLTPAVQKQMLGDRLADVTAEYKSYEQSLLPVISAGLGSKDWVADTVKQGVNDLFDVVATAEGAHNLLKIRVTAMDIAIGATRKDKQAVDRNARGDVRRLLKPWEQAKLPVNWRLQLHCHGLTRDDIETKLEDIDAYSAYVASQPAAVGAMPLLTDWAKPMWFEEDTEQHGDDAGARFSMVGSSCVMLFNNFVMQSYIGCYDDILSLYVFMYCISRRLHPR